MVLGHFEHENALTLRIALVPPLKVKSQHPVWGGGLGRSYSQEPVDVCWQSHPSKSCVSSLLANVLACHDYALLSLCQEETCCQCVLFMPVIINFPSSPPLVVTLCSKG